MQFALSSRHCRNNYFALTLIAFGGVAQAAELPEAAMTEIEALIRTEMTEQKIPGVSLAIMTDFDLTWAKGFGAADIENAIPVTPETVFRLASISKTLTATAVMQLAEQRKINLDIPLQPYCPAYQWPVTTRQVLGHLAGIRHYKDDFEGTITRHFNSVVESLEIFKNDPLLQAPGTKFTYSSFGYNLLGCVIEGASHMAFVDYIKANITGPVGAERLRDDHAFDLIPHRAMGYVVRPDGVWANSAMLDTSYKIPSGGLIGSPSDLIKFASALLKAKLLSIGTLRQMLSEQRTVEGEFTHYGLGWQLGVNNGTAEVYHGGAQERVTNVVVLLPEHRIGVAIMTNREEAKLRRLSRDILNVVLRYGPSSNAQLDINQPEPRIRKID